MKAIQYTTSPYCDMKKTECRPTGGFMGGVSTIKVDEKPVCSDFVGFGVALTGSSCYMLNQMDKEQRKEFLKDIYSADGLALSVARLTVGSSDYSAELYSYDDERDDISLEKFSVDRDREYIIPMIKEVLGVKEDLFLYSSPWTPPAWMKTGGSLCGGHMREKYIDCYANYYVKYLKEYAKEGISIKALTPQNETETTQNGLMPACLWHPDIEAKFIISLKKKLKAEGIDADIWMLDHNFDCYNRVLWMFEEYPELKDDCKAVAWHYYSGTYEMTDIVKEKLGDIEFHFTEGGPGIFENYGEDYCKWASVIINALSHNCRSFTGWNLLLDENGAPNIGPYFCGGLATLSSVTGELSYSGQYRAFKHISKFIRPGAKVYNVSIKGDGKRYSSYPHIGTEVLAVAAENTDSGKVLIMCNPNEHKRQMQYEIGGEVFYFELLPKSVSTVVFEMGCSKMDTPHKA